MDQDEIARKIGRRIKMCRETAGITQAALARAIGVNQAIISKYESGEIAPSITRFMEIAEALSVSTKELLE